MTTISAVSMSHAGRTSIINEDSFLSGGYLPDSFSLETSHQALHEYSYSLASKQTTFFAVFAGLGEPKRARIAAQIAAEELGQEVPRMLLLPAKDVAALADRYAGRVQNKLAFAAQNDATLTDMGSMFAGIAMRGNQAVVINIGGCRAYRYRVGQLRLLSADDDKRYIGMPQTAGKIACTASEALTLRENDRFLICSPGLSDLVAEHELQKCIEIADLHEAARQLMALAVDRGGRKSITATVIAWSENEQDVHGDSPTDLDNVGPAHDKINHSGQTLNRDLKQPKSKPELPGVDKRDVWAQFPVWVGYFGLALGILLIALIIYFVSR